MPMIQNVLPEINNACVCPILPDPLLMVAVGLVVGLFFGMNVILVYVKLRGDPFHEFDCLTDDVDVTGITEEDLR